MKTVSRVLFFILAGALLSTGCATHQTYVSEPLRLIRQGQVEEAIRKLEPLAKQESKDKLVFMMEYGTALHIGGRYKESIDVFSAADKLADELDYYSVTKVTAAALGSEEMVQYKGESYEKLLINAYLALNYLALGNYDDSMVEVRRINDKIKKFRADGREDYELNPFSSYLSALIWEGDGKYDDAYIAFEKTYELDKQNPLLHQDLIRSAKLANRMTAYKEWKKAFPEVVEDPSWYDKKLGQVVLIYEQGWGPQKTFAPHDRRFPRLVPQYSVTQRARLNVANGKDSKTSDSQIIYNVEQVAIRTLNADYANMALRKLGAFATKEVVADQIRQKNEMLGLLARVAMYAADRADLRQWASLPETIQIARIYLAPGEYQISAQGLMAVEGANSPDSLPETSVKVRPGRKTFVTWRSLR